MKPPRADGALRLLLRLILALVGLLLVWLSDYRLQDVREEFATTFRFPVGVWLAYVLVAVLGGVSLGLALVLPSRFDGYRGGRVLVLSLPPLALLVLGLVAVTGGRIAEMPDIVLELTFVYGGAIQGVIAVTLGAVLGAGFAERPRSDGGGRLSPEVGPPG